MNNPNPIKSAKTILNYEYVDFAQAIAEDPSLRDTLRAALDAYQRWVDVLQAGTTVTCVYCGHQYGPNSTTPTSMADALKQHVEQCPMHPMADLKEKYNRVRACLDYVYHNAASTSSLTEARICLEENQ